MEYVLIGLVSAFNLLIIKIKVDKKRYEDAFVDTCLMILLAYLFSGSYAGMVVAMVASLVISIFFLISPPTFTNQTKGFLKSQLDDFNSQFKTKNKGKTKISENFNL